MNKHLKIFLHRGLIFGGLGPIITSVIFLVISLSGVSVELSALNVFTAVVSTYILAFVQAGASVFNQIEDWSIARSLFFHLTSIYLVYVGTYLINFWLPFEPIVILIFTAIFVVSYFAIWLTVYFVMRSVTKKMNGRLSSFGD
jgi:hypothetical protein